MLVTTLGIKPNVQEVVSLYKTEFNEDITFEDAEDCVISLQYDNEVDNVNEYLNYLEMKT